MRNLSPRGIIILTRARDSLNISAIYVYISGELNALCIAQVPLGTDGRQDYFSCRRINNERSSIRILTLRKGEIGNFVSLATRASLRMVDDDDSGRAAAAAEDERGRRGDGRPQTTELGAGAAAGGECGCEQEDVGINSHWLKFVVMRVWHLLMWLSSSTYIASHRLLPPRRRTCMYTFAFTFKCRKYTCSDTGHGQEHGVPK